MAKMRKKKAHARRNRTPQRTTNTSRNNPSKGATLGDALSEAVKNSLQNLRQRLAKEAEAAVNMRLAKPKPRWHGLQPKGKLKPQYLRQVRRKSGSPIANSVRKATTKKSVASRTSSKSRPIKKKGVQTLAEARQSFVFWELPIEAEVRETPPASISKKRRTDFDRVIEAGNSTLQETKGDPLFATIGLDLGTSSTKVIVRFPYEPGSPTIAIPAPQHCRSDDHPYLWQTVLWVDHDGRFYGYPLPDAERIQGLKQRIMLDIDPGPIFPENDHLKEMQRLHAVTAYLTFVIRYVVGWIAEERQALIRDRNVAWSMNLGMAAANYDNGKLIRQYRQVGAAALQLASGPDDITIGATAEFLSNENVVKAAKDPIHAEQLGIAVIPETAAEATGFAKSTDRAAGLYLMVDIGAMTLDVCLFRLVTGKNGTDQYPILMADVRPLGVEAYYWHEKDGRTEEDFIQQSNYCLRNAIWKTISKRDPNAASWSKGSQLVTFLTGGGAENPLHQKITNMLGPWLKTHTENSGIRNVTIQIPETLDRPEPITDFGRLSVAWGLSYPPTEIGEIKPSSAIEDIEPAKAFDISSSYISKDQV